jgi:hypothetical protein
MPPGAPVLTNRHIFETAAEPAFRAEQIDSRNP